MSAPSDTLHTELLRCPDCGGPLDINDEGIACTECAARFERTRSGLDLRPSHVQRRDVPITIGQRGADISDISDILVDQLPVGNGLDIGAEEIFDAGLFHGNRLSPALISHLAVPTGSTVLDLGCGARNVRSLLQPRGIDTVDVDAVGDVPYLVDAHSLPFRESAFDGIITLAVLEHVRSPHQFMAEAFRVLKPGARIVGTSAFLEVFHMDSHFHTTALGLTAALQDAGFEDLVIAPTPNWDIGAILVDMGYLPGVRGPAHTAIRAGLTRSHRFLFRRFRRDVGDLDRRMTFAGGFQFVATKPTTE